MMLSRRMYPNWIDRLLDIAAVILAFLFVIGMLQVVAMLGVIIYMLWSCP